jgi:NADP-dependent 3-hydroxy acid dehydrogenase YdfG
MLDYGLDDEVGLITGRSDGLGRTTAELFVLEGAKVVIYAQRSKNLFQVVDKI